MKRLAIKKFTVPVVVLMIGGGWIFYPGKADLKSAAIDPVISKAITCSMPAKAKIVFAKEHATASAIRR